MCAWPCAYIYHNSSNWWGVMINDVVDEMHPATIITKHVHKHIRLWNSERWWSFGDIVIAGRVWSACCILGWSGYHWRRALVTHLSWRASCVVYEKHMWSGQWEEKYDSSNHLWQFSLKCNPAKQIHTHTQTDYSAEVKQTHEPSLNKSPLSLWMSVSLCNADKYKIQDMYHTDI